MRLRRLRIDRLPGIEPGLDRLRVQQERAAGAVQLRSELKQVRGQIDELEVERHDFAAECGLDPELTGAPLLRFVTAVKDLNSARADHAKQLAAVEKLGEEIAKAAAQVREFVREWCEAESPPLEDSVSEAGLQALRSAWDALRERLREAGEASAAIDAARKDLLHNSERVDDLDAEIARTLSRLTDEQGRQFFYFTARRQDAALWEDAIGEAPTVIDLAEVRFGARDDVSLPPVAPAPRVPPPAGMDDEA